MTKTEYSKSLKKTLVGVDARPLAYGITGNSRYLSEVLANLINENDFEFILYSNKPISSIFKQLTNHKNIKVNSSISGNGLIWLNFKLPSQLKKDNIDVFWGTLQLLPILPLGIPAIVNYHDLNFIRAPETMSFANFLQHRLFSGMTLKKAKKIFCLSENTRNDILKYNPALKDKLLTVYPGVKKTHSTGKYPYKNFIFTVGTLEPRKNIGIVVEAYLILKKEIPDFKIPLIIAGRFGWKEEDLTIKLKSGILEKEGIYFIENPADDLLNFLYKNCLLFLFPSIHEGFGLPLLEALQENKVCIASAIPVFTEILDKEIDFFVPPKDKIAWKNAILNALKKRKRSWNASLWTWENTAQTIALEIRKAVRD